MKGKSLFVSLLLLVMGMVNLYANNSNRTNNKYIKELNDMNKYLDTMLLPDYWKTIRKQESKKNISISGMSRFNFVYYYMKKNPIGIRNRSFFYSHTPSYEPNLKFDIWANPDDKVGLGFSFGFKIGLTEKYTTEFQLANNYILYINLENELGKQFIRIGGPEWRILTPFSFSTPGWYWTIYPFERNSWDNIWMSYWKYKNLTEVADLEKSARGEGAPGAKGFYIDWWQAPFDIHLTGFVGKMDNSTLFYQNSSYEAYFLVEKYLAKFRIGVAYKFHNINPSDKYIEDGFNENRVVYLDVYPFSIGKLYFEYGQSLSKYLNSDLIIGNGYLLDWKKSFADVNIFKKINIGASFYYIEPRFIGEYTGVFHISKKIKDYPLTYYGENNMGAFSLYNNMEGVNFVTEYSFFNMKLNINYSFSKTLEKTTNVISYSHSLNHSIWYVIYANIEPWCQNFQYYDDGNTHFLNRYWEGAGETIYLSDVKSYRRYFDYFNINLGINLSGYFKWLKESFIFFTYSQKTMWNSYQFIILANNNYAPIFGGNSSYVFWAQRILNGFYLLMFKGVENWYSTNTVVKVNQNDNSYGIGIDWIFNDNSALFLKFRKYYFTDEIFNENNMDGIKNSIEWKFQF